jgi:glycosyltransferase involved in cell wall biosynthesis
MKVLMLTPFYYPPIGGAEVATEQLALQLNARNIITDVMTFTSSSFLKPISTVKIKGIRVIQVPAINIRPLKFPELIFQVSFLPRIFVELLKDYDILHFQNDIDLTFPLFSRRVSKPKVFHCRCPAPMFRLYQRNPVSQRLFRNSANIFIVISEELVKYIVGLKVPKENIRVVPNGIDTNLFKPFGRKVENMLLFVGRLEPVKGLHVLLEALNYVKTRVKLVIIGGRSWHQEYSDYILNLIEQAKKKSAHEIIYLGQLKRNQIVEWYQKASIHVRPDTNGISGGNTALEAMACATPVIGTGNGIIKDEVNGVIVHPNNAVELAKAIESLINNNRLRRKLGENARKFVEKYYSFDVAIEKITQIYNEILEKYKN